MRTIGLIGSIIWTGFIAFLGTYAAVPRSELVCGKEKERFSPAFAMFAILPILLWAGFREGRGYVDTNAYIIFYTQIPSGISQIIEYIKNIYGEDPGFTFLTGVIKTIFGSSYTPYLFIIAAIQCIIVTLFFRKYSNNFCFSLFLFIASAECFSWIFNGMRQFLAVAITLAGFRFLIDKEYIKYFFIVVLACTIHLTAIIMLPVAFIVQGKPWNKKTISLIVFAILSILFTSQFIQLLNTAMRGTQYSENISTWDDDGVNPIRVLFYAIPTVFAFAARDKIEEDDDPIINICVNMSIISTTLWLIAMVTSGIHMGRLPVYVNLVNFLLLPYLIDNYFDNVGTAKLAKLITVIVYLVYYYYQVHITWQAI